MKREQLYLSTIDPNAGELARQYGLGLEIAEFCTAWNMDRELPQTAARLGPVLTGVERRVLHAPFNELFPCAIDPKARELAAFRFRQAVELAQKYGATKVIIHGGYNPKIYYPVWYVQESVKFWREFLDTVPYGQIVLENVLEEEPGMLLDILRGVGSERLGVCLDVGHVNAYSGIPVADWVDTLAPWLSHFHIHNNDGTWDTHSPLDRGTIPMEQLLEQADRSCPNATFTLEFPDSRSSVEWLLN